jgi:hypothetical protein
MWVRDQHMNKNPKSLVAGEIRKVSGIQEGSPGFASGTQIAIVQF